MAILLDNKEVTDFVNTTENVNVLSYKSIEEVHDSIYMITTHDNQTFLKEKKGEWKTKPVVEFSIHTGNTLHKNVKFVLEKSGKSSINFSKFGLTPRQKVSDRRVLQEDQTKTQLVTNKPAPVSTPPAVSEDKMKQYIESAILQMLTSDKSESFTKFFDVYTEGFKRDMIKYTEKISRRETYRVMESGGGTNAVQYADGGTMNGNLNVNGNVNASNMLTGHISLSSLLGDGATDGQMLSWSASLNRWIPYHDGDMVKVISTIGNNVDSTFTINHALSSTYLIHQVYDATTFEVVHPHIQNIDGNHTVVSFSFVPAASAYKLVTIK